MGLWKWMTGSASQTYEELEAEEARLRREGDYEGALRVLNRMIALKGNSSYAYNNKGAILLMAERYSDALPALAKAVELDPDNGQALNNYGFCLFATGRSKEAIPLYRSALEKGYRHEGVYRNLGMALFATDKAIDALTEWETALRINPLYREILQHVYQLGQMMGIVQGGQSVDHTTVTRIKELVSRGNYTIRYLQAGAGGMLMAERR